MAQVNADTLEPSTEAFLFSVCLAVLNVLDPGEVSSRFDAVKDQLTSTYQSSITKLVLAAHTSNLANI